MLKFNKLVSCILLLCFFLNIVISFPVSACKDIVACGDATDGDYNLLLKVRDPSRPGLQVLCIVPEGYAYSYHHPWNGKSMSFTTEHKYIGVASKGDTIPNIVKAGMTLSDAGISYGDADTGSNWKNPTKHAWDDFDWIRYACEKADDEDEAVALMTKDVVDKLHASGVSENLFIVGPKKAFVVEADAFRYKVKEIDDVLVMSNYPKELWKTQCLKTLPIARSFDTTVERKVRNRGIVRLKSLHGVKIVGMGEDWIDVVPVNPLFRIAKRGFMKIIVKIQVGEQKTVENYNVKLLGIENNKAKISVCYKFKAWEDKMMQYIQSKYGSITVKDMINWSRLHKEDLEGLRGMCQKGYKYEAVAIYKIPNKNYNVLSSGWFSANHACSSIYVPFHICNNDIFDPFETGEAAQLSLDLLDLYELGVLSLNFSKTEEVFINEIETMEEIAKEMLTINQDVSDFLTIVDMGIQKQAYNTEELWMTASKASNKQAVIDVLANLWGENYTFSLQKMRTVIDDLELISGTKKFREKISDIALDICKTRIDAANSIGKQTDTIEEEYQKAKKLVKQGEYEQGFDGVQKAYRECDMLLKGEEIPVPLEEEKEKYEINLLLIVVIILIIVFILILAVVLTKKQD